MNSVLTEEQVRAVDNYMATNKCDLDITEHRMNKKELYDKLQNNPKFDACYRQAISEKLVKKGILEKINDAGYPDDDPDLILARKYAQTEYNCEMERTNETELNDSEISETVDNTNVAQPNNSTIYINHVSQLVINFNIKK